MGRCPDRASEIGAGSERSGRIGLKRIGVKQVELEQIGQAGHSKASHHRCARTPLPIGGTGRFLIPLLLMACESPGLIGKLSQSDVDSRFELRIGSSSRPLESPERPANTSLPSS